MKVKMAGDKQLRVSINLEKSMNELLCLEITEK